MFVGPEYKHGLFRRKCIFCKAKTRERVGHVKFDLNVFGRIIKGRSCSVPAHHDCHDKNKCPSACDVGYRVYPRLIGGRARYSCK